MRLVQYSRKPGILNLLKQNKCIRHASQSIQAKDKPADISKFEGLKAFFPPDFQELDVEDDGADKTVKKFGEAWSEEHLRTLNSATLHRLWYVLLKDRNALLTADSYYRMGCREVTPLHYVKKLEAVQQGLENLKSVIQKREETIDSAKTFLWLNRVAKVLGKEYALDLAKTYIQYTFPHTDKEQEEIVNFKHYQLFDKYFNRLYQPYEHWHLKLYKKAYWEELERFENLSQKEKYQEIRRKVWERKLQNYESEDEYLHEMDYFPVTEGFLHDIKREDWEEILKDPEDMVESRERRELDRLKIVKKIWQKQVIEDAVKGEENKREWLQFSKTKEVEDVADEE